jgi:hypothetical protein
MAELIGPDFASIDGNKTPDFTAAKNAGARFAIVRAIYGRSVGTGTTTYADPVWARDKDAIKAAGLVRGAYLFICYPNSQQATPSPVEQAQAFCSYVTLDKGRDLPPIIDVEEASDTMRADQMFDWTVTVAETLRAHYGAWPMLYTSARVWHENLRDHAAGVLGNCPLWLAKPWPWPVRTEVHLDGAPNYVPYAIPQFGDSTNWWIYQYQGDAFGWPGFTSTVDANRFHTLKKGKTGDVVRWVQKRVGTTADGIFGVNTEAAVKSFQTKAGLAADGIVGPQTFAALAWV